MQVAGLSNFFWSEYIKLEETRILKILWRPALDECRQYKKFLRSSEKKYIVCLKG